MNCAEAEAQEQAMSLEDRSAGRGPDVGAPYRTAPPDPPRRRTIVTLAARLRGRAALGVIVALVLGWTAWIGWIEQRTTAAIASLPTAERRASYQLAVDELRGVCVREPRLIDHCREQAEFVIKFPECDDDCRGLVHRYFSEARR
jgi:hypothetical protein